MTKNELRQKRRELHAEIEKVKRKLIEDASDKGLNENFGSFEVNKLWYKYIDITDYSLEMNSLRNLIEAFDNWCLTYTGM